MKTTENNKLIAEFWGMELGDDKTMYYDDAENLFPPTPIDELKFHDDWNWIMPVVQKCYKIDDEEGFDNLVDAVSTLDFDAMYQAVVEFIKKYNEENKVDKTHQHLREILIKYNSPEYGDCIVDEICNLFSFPMTDEE